MNHALIRTSGLILAAMFAFATLPVGAATTATGPYYANPSWDQQLPASTRFIVLSNWVDTAHPSGGAAVLDRETGLIWEQSPDATPQDWATAQSTCVTKNVGGRKGWKLPSVQELASLIDPTTGPVGPTLPAGHPFMNVRSSTYWSATTTIASDTSTAWVVVFIIDGLLQPQDKSFVNYAWCVRGGSGGDAQ